MNYARSWAIAFAIISVSSAAAEEQPVEIPLKEAWAYQMPGMQDIRELPSVRADSQVLESIRQALKQPLDKKPRRGFVVAGTGDEALRNARNVLAATDKPKARFTGKAALSAVFFAYRSPFYVELEKVERKGTALRISYRLVPHESADITSHLALIPLGELPPGRYSVRVEQSPMEKKYTELGFTPPPTSAVEQIICGTFHFIVAE